MPVRGQRQVRKYRGVIRAQLTKNKASLTSIKNRDIVKPFLTAGERLNLGVWLNDLNDLLIATVLV